MEHGIIFLLLGGEDFHTYSTLISGWKPLKRKFRVTKADRQILYELDGNPALGVYRRFLNINKNDSFFSNTLEFPLFLEHGDIDILRCPLAVNDDESFVMSSDVQEDAIVRLADVLRNTTIGVNSCYLGRWGGEEFMILLSDSNADDAEVLAEKIRLEFSSVSYETAGCQTVSIGVSQAKDETADALYSRVDNALIDRLPQQLLGLNSSSEG